MKRTVSLVLMMLASILVAACQQLVELGSSPSSIRSRQELVVFAAASLTDVFEELGVAFSQTHPQARLTFNFAGSQQLAQQLAGGAPADVFAPANQKQMHAAIDIGRVIPDASHPFAHNRLVVIMPFDNPAGIAALTDLARPGIKLVLADDAVPVGQYSIDFLAKASALPNYTAAFSETVLANVVSYEENVRAVLTKVRLGEADAGIVYTSDVTGETRDQIARLDIPDHLNVVATYPIAPVSDSAQSSLAAQFVEFVLSPEGQQVLEKYGFIPISPK